MERLPSEWVKSSMGNIKSTRWRVLIISEIHFGADPELAEMASGLSDDQIEADAAGGHDPANVCRLSPRVKPKIVQR